jgi:hypothetical protein
MLIESIFIAGKSKVLGKTIKEERFFIDKGQQSNSIITKALLLTSVILPFWNPAGTQLEPAEHRFNLYPKLNRTH